MGGCFAKRAPSGNLETYIWTIASVLAPLSNSWIILIIWLYIALNRTPNIDCYWGGGGGSTPIIALYQTDKVPIGGRNGLF